MSMSLSGKFAIASVFLFIFVTLGLQASFVIAASPAPVASFTSNVTIGTAPIPVQFNDTSSNAPTSWSWNFGDGSTSTLQDPVHVYSSTGSYNVTLTATNGGGSNTSGPLLISVFNLMPLPNYHDINLYVANNAGVKYNVPNGSGNSVFNYTYVPNTYFVQFEDTTGGGTGGGLNPLHISDTPAYAIGNITTTTNQSGTFWVTFNGGQPTMDDGVLMLAVNGTIPDNFSVNLQASGYTWALGPPAQVNYGAPTNYTYVTDSLNETFYRSNFIYGPQNWKPCSSPGFPILNGENMSDPGSQYEIMFIDLNAGAFNPTDFGSLIDNGYIKVQYSFNNLMSAAVFNDYGWYIACNHGTGICMTNNVANNVLNSSGLEVLGLPYQPTSFRLGLSQGWNLVSFPVVNSSLNASSLAGSGVSVVSAFDASTGDYSSFIEGVSPASDDFVLAGNYGYFLYCSANTSLVVYGVNASNPSVMINPGWNMIGWSLYSNSTAEALCNAVSSGSGHTVISQFNPSTGDYNSYIDGVSPNSFNFAVTPGTGYFLYSGLSTPQTLYYDNIS